jgi:sulfate permease
VVSEDKVIMFEKIFIILLSIFVGMNMGVSGFAVAFSPSYGSGVIKKYQASILHSIFLVAGAIIIGPRVVETLINKITDPLFLQKSTIIIIVLSIGISMFISNLFKVPQSTSFVTVSAFTGAAIFHQKFYYYTIIKIFTVAILFSLVSFLSAYLLTKIFYPPRNSNFRLYEKFFLHKNKMRKFIIGTDCYSSFGIGTNNVANVVAPLICILPLNISLCMILVAGLFGLGGFVFGKRVIHNLSKNIIPIGEPSAVIISFITSTLAIIASILGLPTPYAQFTSFSFFGISCLKDGVSCTFKKPVVKNFLSVWIITPLLTAIFSYILHLLFVRR